MATPTAVESFVAAVACLCASSYGPNVKPQTDLRANIASSVSDWDRNVLQVLINSKSKFSFMDNSGDCELPDSDAIDARLYDLEYETAKQKQQTAQLMGQLKVLRDTCKKPEEKLLESDEEKVRALKAEVAILRQNVEDFKTDVIKTVQENSQLKVQHQNDQAELTKLSTEIKSLKDELQKATTPKSKNGCLLTQKHGVSNLEICIKQNIFCAKNLDRTYGDGWMLVSQRFNGSVHFYFDWNNYAEGFGRHGADFEFFIGFERIYTLTRMAQHELLFVLTDINNQTRYAHYDNFAIGEATRDYELKSLGHYSGDAGDSLSYHLKQKFSTFDKNNVSKCAEKHTGAWWYKNGDCHRSNLFGLYRTRRPKDDQHKLNGMIWSTFHNTDDGSLVSMRMYIRPKADVKS